MEVGKTFTLTQTVDENMLACAVGSGCVSVFATPMMIALMEKCAAACVQDELPQGDSTVGTMIRVSHAAATPVGMKVTATATVTAVEGRKISFAVKAEDECGLIGEGTHERVIIHVDRFNEKAEQKKQK
ncbi:MAG: thioesterase family protein [Negativibacillus sp.]